MKKKAESVKTFFIYILYIIMIPILLYDLFLIIQSTIHPDNTPNFFGIKSFSIVSQSMEPTIHLNDMVFIKKTDGKDIRKNDIITFRMGNEIITHRVIQIERLDNKVIYTTKGDSNEVTDLQKVTDDQIEGKYIGKIPKVGGFLSSLKDERIFGILLLFIFMCFWWERKSIDKKIERKEKRERYEREKRLQAM